MPVHITETGKIGKKGVFTIPASMRRHFGFDDGSLVIAEQMENGVLLRPAVAIPVELYSDMRAAEFLLSNAIDNDDYQAARREVEAMGLDPDLVPHKKPVI